MFWGDEAFRTQVRAFLAENLPEHLRAGMAATPGVFVEPDIGQEWQRILHAKGWLAYNWPVDCGGTGALGRCKGEVGLGRSYSHRRPQSRWEALLLCSCADEP